MQFRFSEEDRQFRIRADHLPWDDQLPDGWWGEEAYDDTVWPFTLEMRKKLGEKGWLAISWPKEYGGQDASPGQSMIYSEEMAYKRAPGKDIQGVGFIGPCLMIHGTEEQKRQAPADPYPRARSHGVRASASRSRAPTWLHSRPEPSRTATTS